MIQLWVNLPAKDKMNKPRYQGLKNADIPRLAIADKKGYLRVIAGEYANVKGPALTHSPMNLWDIRLEAGARESFAIAKGHTTSVFVLKGKVTLGSGEEIPGAHLAVLDTQGDSFSFEVSEDSQILLMSGEPLNEPIVGYGPFVMNTKAEIQQAFVDFQEGRMGKIAEVEGSEVLV
jgi:redox-sensitive bicupin YhaK (pirin superfamily)